ncbi:glucosaminidase domain-containing protein [Aquimarina sp. ERC-38]|uniref:glucosaminidase domain-containing protein n=1 Tax=Aquimarina sp. ERC-38 TaxID=2949996 RepID=UPI002247CCA4|nr:glucosaminidase domain-containing protein [Aquimarina sp. ERC-38]UZO81141.1 glucosaminidase domain-containing protein [Aquimarina sp. ERC-38]
MNKLKFLKYIGVGLILLSCGGNKKAITSTSRKELPVRTKEIQREVRVRKEVSKPKAVPLPATSYNTKVQQYINAYSRTAQDEMATYGIPASITLAQGILESGAGYGELTSRANNHFGIKCHGWTGDRVYHDDDLSQECFRKYNDPSESFRDHSLFLKNRKRYAKLFTYRKDDYRAWAKGLKAAGYATDPKYPAKLISIIERFGLATYDKPRTVDIVTETPAIVEAPTPVPVPEKTVGEANTSVQPVPAKTTETTNKNEQYEEYKVESGDTLYSIAKRFDMEVSLLKAINELTDNTISIGQVLKLKQTESEFDEF